MTSLFENLPALEAAAQGITGHMAELLEESAAVQAGAEELIEDVKSRSADASALREKIRPLLERIEELATRKHGDLDVAAAGVESAAEAASQGVAGAQDELEAAAAEAGEALSGLQSELADGGPALEAAESETDAALDALGGALGTGQEELGAAVESAASEAQALRDAGQQAHDRVAQAAQALTERMEAVLDQARARVNELGAAIESLGGDQEGTISGEAARLASGAQGLGDDVEARLEADVREAVAAQVEAVVSAFGDLVQKIGAARETAAAEREALEDLLARLNERMEPLPGAIDCVRSAASLVGLAWG